MSRLGTVVAATLSITLLSSATLARVDAASAADGALATYILVATDTALPAGIAEEVAARGGAVLYALPEVGIAIATSSDPAFAISAGSIAGLRSAIKDVWQPFEVTSFAEPPFSTDDDRFFNMQWALSAIDAPRAWATGARGAGVRVAVLDTGVDMDHPDLVSNLNVALSRSFIPGVPVDAPPGPASFQGPPHHGTWVAGIIAAADNGIGTIGVAPEAEIVAERVCPDSGRGCPSSAILAGLVYAAQHDADVVNLSIDMTVPRRGFIDAAGNLVSAADAAELLTAFTRAFEFAHRRGATIVGIAGNQASDLDADADVVHLAQLPFVIAVAATGPRGWGSDPNTELDRHACYSNYGRSAVDLSAPGGNADCSLPIPPRPPYVYCKVVVTLPCWAFDFVVGPTVNGWSVDLGTSAAAPHVAGVAALVIGTHGGAMDPDTVEAVLRATSDDLGAPGLDPLYGQGRVNAARAVGAE